MDRIAETTGVDPAEVRRRNFLQPDAFPHLHTTGLELDSGDYEGTLDLALGRAGYPELQAERERARADGRRLGIGLGFELTPESADVPGALVTGFDTATVRMSPSGQAIVLTGVTSPGTGNDTAIVQLVAGELGIALARRGDRAGRQRPLPLRLREHLEPEHRHGRQRRGPGRAGHRGEAPDGGRRHAPRRGGRGGRPRRRHGGDRGRRRPPRPDRGRGRRGVLPRLHPRARHRAEPRVHADVPPAEHPPHARPPREPPGLHDLSVLDARLARRGRRRDRGRHHAAPRHRARLRDGREPGVRRRPGARRRRHGDRLGARRGVRLRRPRRAAQRRLQDVPAGAGLRRPADRARAAGHAEPEHAHRGEGRRRGRASAARRPR